jgi:hypothetical protein
MTRIRFIAWTIWNVCRHPPTRRIAWTMVAAWTVALFLPGLSIFLSPHFRGLDMTTWVGWSNTICIALDLFMLYTSIHGLLWSYGIPRR